MALNLNLYNTADNELSMHGVASPGAILAYLMNTSLRGHNIRTSSALATQSIIGGDLSDVHIG